MNVLELIADPVRLKIVRRLAHGGPASLQELADAADVHLNTARVHVSALEEAGAVLSRPRQRRGRGRQGLEYELAEGWTLGSDDFRAVAEILASGMSREGISSETRVELGRAWGRYVLGRPGNHQPEEEVVRALAWFGQLAEISGDQLQLAGCPCILVSPDDPTVVCDLAVGIVDGIFEASGSERRVRERKHDHTRRRCHLELSKPG